VPVLTLACYAVIDTQMDAEDRASFTRPTRINDYEHRPVSGPIGSTPKMGATRGQESIKNTIPRSK